MKKIIRTISLIISVIIISGKLSSLLAQYNAANWYFGGNILGNYAGIRFDPPGNTPGCLLDGQMVSDEGVAVASTDDGDLLFYTNGEKVWNRNHLVMPNGDGLFGHVYSTAVIVVPYPENDSLYYIFTTDHEGGSNGTNYDIVNMNAALGFGDVIVKNVQLLDQSQSTEKITAVRHSDGSSVWVVTHSWGDSKFRAYLVSNTGLDIDPVISDVGNLHFDANTEGKCGYIKLSPNGKKIALVSFTLGFVEVLNFNTSTGIVSSSCKTFSDTVSYCYGVEFSPDNSKLYVSQTWKPGNCSLFQYDLNAGLADDIIQSRKTIFSSPDSLGALQLTPNNKIFVVVLHKKIIGSINSPNNYDVACNYNHTEFSLCNRICNFGLPTFIQSYFNDPGDTSDFSFSNSCFGDSTIFTSDLKGGYDSVKWDFDDITSGINNYSYLLNPKHLFTSSGAYSVKLIQYNCEGNDTIVKSVTVNYQPVVNLGNDTAVCQNSSLTLDAENTGATYLWNDGSTQQTLNANTLGIYSVTVTSANCNDADSITVIVNPLPSVDLGIDNDICQDSSLTIDAGNPGAAYLWNDGSTEQTSNAGAAGIYSVTVTSLNCSDADSIIISIHPEIFVTICEDTTICNGSSIVLHASGGTVYSWHPGNSLNDSYSSDPVASPDTSTTYYVTVSDGKCISTDSIRVSVDDRFALHIPNSFTPNNDGLNDIFKINSAMVVVSFYGQIFNRWGSLIYEWSDAESGWDGKYKDKVVPEGVYVYVIKSEGLCGRKEITGHVTLLK